MTVAAVPATEDRRTEAATFAAPPVPSRVRRPLGVGLGLAAAVPLALVTVLAVVALRQGRMYVDMAMFDQALWSLSRGHAPVSSIVGRSILGDHFAPGLLLFGIPYRIVATPVWLVVGQGIAVWSTLVQIGRRLHVIEQRRVVGLVALLAVSPIVTYTLLLSVSGWVLALPFALAALWAADDDHPRRAAVFAVLAACFRLELGFAVLVGIAALRRRNLRFPVVVTAAYLAFAVLAESALGNGSHFTVHYGNLGTGPVDAVLHPWRIVAALVTGTAAKAPVWLFASGLIGVVRPRRAAAAAAVALPVVLSRWPGTFEWQQHYSLAPTLLLAFAWVPVVNRRPSWIRAVVAANVMFLVLSGPWPVSLQRPGAASAVAQIVRGDDRLATMAARIPSGAGVAGDAFALAALSHRDDVYLWPSPFRDAPADQLPNGLATGADPVKAARVSYLLITANHAVGIPSGFTLQAERNGVVLYARSGIAR